MAAWMTAGAVVAGAWTAGAASAVAAPAPRAAAAPAPAAKIPLQVGGADVEVAVATAGGSREVLVAGAAGQKITLAVTSSSFADACSVQLSVATAGNAELLAPTCAGVAGDLPEITVPGTALLHVTVKASEGATGSVALKATGTGTSSLTPGAAALTVTAPPKQRTVLVLPANAGDTLSASLAATGDTATITPLAVQVVRNQHVLAGPYKSRGSTLSFAVPVQQNGELRLWVLNHDDEPLTFTIATALTTPRRGTLALGTPVTVPLRAGGQLTDLTYTAEAGTAPSLQVRVSGTTGASSTLGLLSVTAPDGDTVVYEYLTRQQRVFDLPVSSGGTYHATLTAVPGADGRAVLTLLPPATHQDLTRDEPATVVFDGANPIVKLSLPVNRGDLVSLEATNFDVETPDGEVATIKVRGGDGAGSDWGDLAGDDLLRAVQRPPGWSHTWTITLTAPAGATGSLVLTPHAGAVTPIAVPLGKATPLSVTRGQPYADLTVEAKAGDVLAVQVDDMALSPAGGVVRMRTGTTGRLQYQGALGEDGTIRTLYPVAADGTLTLRFSVGWPSKAGSFTATVTRSESSTQALTPGTPTTVDLEAAVQRFTVTGAVGDRLSVSLSDQTSDRTSVLLTRPDGTSPRPWVFGSWPSTAWTELRTAGTYTLTLVGHGTLTLRVDLVRPRTLPKLSDGVATEVQMTPADANVVVPLPDRATTALGYVVALTGVALTGDDGYLYVELLDRGGKRADFASQYVYGDRDLTIPASAMPRFGGYSLRFTAPGSSDSLTITARVTKPTVRTLTPGTPTTLRLKETGHAVRLQVPATAGQVLSWDLTTSRWRDNGRRTFPHMVVVRPDGTIAASSWAWPSNGPVIDVTATGTWAIVLDASRLTGVMTLTPYLATATTGTLDLDGDTEIDLSARPAVANLSFTAVEGQRMSLMAVAADLTAPAGSPELDYTISSEDGGVVWDTSTSGQNTGALTWSPLSLAAGDYRLRVRSATATGSVTLHAATWEGEDEPGAITVGGSATATISSPQRPTSYTFTGAAGQRLGFQLDASKATTLVPGDEPYAALYLQGPDGSEWDYWELAEGTDTFADVTLDVAGTWRLILEPVASTVGAIEVGVLPTRTVSQTAASGTPVSLALDRMGDRGVVTLPAPSGHRVVVSVDTTWSTDLREWDFVRLAQGEQETWLYDDEGEGRLYGELDVEPGTPVVLTLDAAWAATADVSVTMTSVDDVTQSWTPGTSHTLSLAAGQNAVVTLPDVAVGQHAVLHVTDLTLREGAAISVRATEGSQSAWAWLSSPGWYAVDLAQSTAGAQTLTLDPDGATGPVSITATVTLVADVTGTLVAGKATQVKLTAPGMRGKYRLKIPSRTRTLTFAVTGATAAGTVCTVFGCADIPAGSSTVVLTGYQRWATSASVIVSGPPGGTFSGSVTASTSLT